MSCVVVVCVVKPIGSNSNVRISPILRANSLAANRKERNNETQTSQAGRAPETGRVLLRDTVALLDIDCFGDGGGDG